MARHVAYVSLLLISIFNGLYGQDSTLIRNWAGSEFTFSNKNGLGSLGKQAIEYPNNSNLYALQRLDFWITGISAFNDTVAIGSDVFSQKSSWRAGPAATSGLKSHPNFNEWVHFSEVSASDINYHKANYSNGSYTAPNGIKNWPSNYKLSGFPSILAPFADVNANNLYDFNKGDYPYVPGSTNIFTMAADSTNGLFSSGNSQKIDQSVIWFTPINTDSVPNTIFFRLTICNRGAINYQNMKVSVVSSFSIGDPNDNFVFTDVAASAIVGYNALGTDAQYGNNWPALAVGWLSRSATNSIYFENSVDKVRGKPSIPADFYQLANGHWKTSKFLSFGSSGLDGNTPADFVFSNGTDAAHNHKDWDEVPGTAGRRNALISTGGWDLTGGSCKLADGFVTIIPNAPDSAKIRSDLQKIHRFYRNSDWVAKQHQFALSKHAVYPNPVKTGMQLYFNREMENQEVKLFDISGKFLKYLPLNAGSVSMKAAPGIYILQFGSFNSAKVIVID